MTTEAIHSEPESREIWHHGFIGGLVAVVLAAFEEVAQTIFKQVYEHDAVAWYFGMAVVIFITALFGINRIEQHFLRKEMRARAEADRRAMQAQEQADNEPIRLTVGDVRGSWFDAIYNDVGKLLQCSVIDFRSTQRDGFSVSGKTYDIADIEASDACLPVRYHPFNGDGFAFHDKKGFSYVYTGSEGKPDYGVGYYAFNRAGELTFSGAFVSASLDPDKVISARYVRGRQATDAEAELLQRKNGEVLRDFLAQCDRNLLINRSDQG